MQQADEAVWMQIRQSLERSEPLVCIVNGEADGFADQLHGRLAGSCAWHDAGKRKERTRQVPFAMWAQVIGSDAIWTGYGPHRQVPPDAEDPLLTDPAAVYQKVYEWVCGQGPAVIVVREADRGDEDSLRALGYVLRRMEEGPIVLVLQMAGEVTPRWLSLTSLWTAGVPIANVQAEPAEMPLYEEGLGEPFRSGRIMEWMNAGALYEGTKLLIGAIAGSASQTMSSKEKAGLWLLLAQALFMQKEYEQAAWTARQAAQCGDGWYAKRMARRVLLLALRQLNSPELPRIGREALAELEDLEGTERPMTESLTVSSDHAQVKGWLRMDAALGFSLDDPHGECRRQLETLTSASYDAVSGPCRAGGLLWLASVCVWAGEGERATALQRQGLKELELLGDMSRAAFVRYRLAASIDGQGNIAEAAEQFELASHDLRALGIPLLAEIARAEAAAAYAQAGQPVKAERLLRRSANAALTLGEQAAARLFRLWAAAALLTASGQLESAEALCGRLLLEIETLPQEHASVRLHLECQGRYLLADLAESRGDILAALQHMDAGLQAAAAVSQEERPRLIGSGERRLSRIVQAEQTEKTG